MPPQPANVRQLASDIAIKASRSDRFLEDVLDNVLDSPQGQALDDRDRRLLRELVLGSCRRQVTLDHIIAHYASRPLNKIYPPLLEILRQAVYQLVYLERVPPHAAVNEAVALAASLGHASQGGFANAILRAVSRAMDTEGPSLAVIPTSTRLVHFGDPFLPDPAEDLAGYLSVIGSIPREMIERWLGRWSANTVQQISDAANLVPGVFVHPNALRTNPDTLARVLVQDHRELVKSEDGKFFRIQPTDGLAKLAAFAKGLFWVMDPASTRAVAALQVAPGQSVLDLCSAPGSKTALIAEQMGNVGRIVAVDVAGHRLKLVRENIDRLGLAIVTTVVADGRQADTIVHEQFDRVLVDVPCSNTGVLARRVQARHRFRPERLAELSGLQLELLLAGFRMLRPGGRLVYSTCSLETEENEDVVASAARDNVDLKVESSRTYLPEAGVSDGGFVAVIAKGRAEG